MKELFREFYAPKPKKRVVKEKIEVPEKKEEVSIKEMEEDKISIKAMEERISQYLYSQNPARQKAHEVYLKMLNLVKDKKTKNRLTEALYLFLEGIIREGDFYSDVRELRKKNSIPF